MSEIDDEEEDIENIERLAEGLANTHNGGNHHNEKEKKKKFSKKTNRFHELNYFLNTIPTETKKMTRDEKKAVEYQKMFDKMEEVNIKIFKIFLKSSYFFLKKKTLICIFFKF